MFAHKCLCASARVCPDVTAYHGPLGAESLHQHGGEETAEEDRAVHRAQSEEGERRVGDYRALKTKVKVSRLYSGRNFLIFFHDAVH